MSDSNLELEDSKEEAARALFDPSQVTLQALTHGISQASVRRRLLAFIAGAPPQSIAPLQSHPRGGPSAAQASGPEQRRTGGLQGLRDLGDGVGSGPIVVYIRKPR